MAEDNGEEEEEADVSEEIKEATERAKKKARGEEVPMVKKGVEERIGELKSKNAKLQEKVEQSRQRSSYTGCGKKDRR